MLLSSFTNVWLCVYLLLQHFYLPFCPVATSTELRDTGFFSDVNTSPFFIGCEGIFSYQKKDSETDQRFRIRVSFAFKSFIFTTAG